MVTRNPNAGERRYSALSTAFPPRSGFASPSIVCTIISSTLQVPYAGKTTCASSTASYITLVNPADPGTAQNELKYEEDAIRMIVCFQTRRVWCREFRALPPNLEPARP